MFTVPVTRGSRMKLRPVCWPTVLITDWMSAFTKLTVIFSSPLLATIGAAGAGAWARASGPRAAGTHTAAAATRVLRKLRIVVTYWGFSFDLSGIVRRKPGRGPGFATPAGAVAAPALQRSRTSRAWGAPAPPKR